MALFEKLSRFARKPLSGQWAAIKATFSIEASAAERRRLNRLLTGAHAPPRVLQSDRKTYIAYRPDSDVRFKQHPELAQLSKKWTQYNLNNAGDLQRLYLLAINIKQVLEDNIPGDMAELGVYRGNSAAVLAHYAKIHRKNSFYLILSRDLTGVI